MQQSMNVMSLIKDDVRYVFLFHTRDLPTFLQVLGRYAADPEHQLTWYDAAILSQKARKLVENNC